MTLEDLGNIGEFVGAIGVVASLLYVGLEVRRNTKTQRAQAYETVTSGYMSVVQVMASNPDTIAKGFKSSYEEFRQFSDGELWYLLQLLQALRADTRPVHPGHDR